MNTPYKISTDVRFSPLELIDVKRMERETRDQWVNQTLCRVNDCVVRLGVDGRFFIDLEGRTVELSPQQGFTVPKGVLHRTRAPERSVILMIEGAGVVPTGD
jgi:hypothetical protein